MSIKASLLLALLCLAPALWAQTPPSYTALTYAPLAGTPQQGSGTLANITYFDGNATGAGHSFNATADKNYKITVDFTAASNVDIDAEFYILKQGALQGNIDDVVFTKYKWDFEVSNFTVTFYYQADASGSTRILLIDYENNNLNYNIKVEEDNTVWFSFLDYTDLIPTNGAKVTGNVNASVDNYIIEDFPATGKGFGFNVIKGNRYKITAILTSEQDFEDGAGFMLLNSGILLGNHEDIFDDGDGGAGGKQITATATIVAKANEQLKILLLDMTKNSYSYEISIENIGEEPAAVTLAQFLNQTTKTITYNANMSFKDSGETAARVIGDDRLFRDDDEYYYAVAYKITLAAGNRIEIHSSKTGDSYLYVYRKDGSDYTLINENDDDGGYRHDSYLNFTAPSAGDYYIVVTDYSPDRAGNYTISVESGEATPITPPAIAAMIGNIRAQAIGNAIVLTNLPANTKIEVYNLQGKRIAGALPATPSLAIQVQTKGMYIVKAGAQTFNLTIK